MKKYDKKDYINLAILIIFFLVFITILILCTKNSIYGSKLDYVDQHYMIPEYFRTLCDYCLSHNSYSIFCWNSS